MGFSAGGGGVNDVPAINDLRKAVEKFDRNATLLSIVIAFLALVQVAILVWKR